MARRNKQVSRKPTDTAEATLRKLQTQLTDPRITRWLWSGARGVRERIMKINEVVLRNAVDRLPLINGIINTRIDQMLPYCTYAEEDGDRGYEFVLRDRRVPESQSKDKEIDALVDFIDQTGFDFDPEREDDFSDFVSMIVRETYVIDQIATEIQRNRIGDARAFWLLDGATIKRVTSDADFARGVRFVQQIDHQIYNEFDGEDIVFDYKYKRADIRYRGYGYSPVEQAIDVITTLLFGYNYIRDQLMRDRVPRGFIAVMGDVGQPEMDAIRNYWWASMTGAGAQFNIPILPSGKDGVGMDFKMLGHNNKDMEFSKTINFVSSLVSAVFSMDLLELGIKTDHNQQVIGENPEPRIASSRDRGLHSMLSFVQQYVNKIVRKVGDKYKFQFVGLIQDDEDKRATTRTKEISAWRSMDEIRKEDGLEPYNEDWSKMPLHPQAVQIFLADRQAEQQKQMADQYGAPQGFSGYNTESNGETDTEDQMDGDSAQDAEAIEKSMRALGEYRRVTRRAERVVRHIIE